jgi:hypothetical protein
VEEYAISPGCNGVPKGSEMALVDLPFSKHLICDEVRVSVDIGVRNVVFLSKVKGQSEPSVFSFVVGSYEVDT